MVALSFAALNALFYHATVHRGIGEWTRDPLPPARARVAGLCSLILWAIVIAAGRTTAYKL